jgi:hypothetical protein
VTFFSCIVPFVESFHSIPFDIPFDIPFRHSIPHFIPHSTPLFSLIQALVDSPHRLVALIAFLRQQIVTAARTGIR